MSTKRSIALLIRIQAHAWSDATDSRLNDEWRFAAAHVSGTVSMQAEMLAWAPRKARRHA